jgi:hypothetical protein
MINPWFSLSLRTARIGLEAQNAVVDSLFRMAETGNSNSFTSTAAPEQIVHLEDKLSNSDVRTKGRSSVAPSAMKVHKRTRRKGRKHR